MKSPGLYVAAYSSCSDLSPLFTYGLHRSALPPVYQEKGVRANVIVPVRPGPPAVVEAALSIFVGATKRLHSSVQRQTTMVLRLTSLASNTAKLASVYLT